MQEILLAAQHTPSDLRNDNSKEDFVVWIPSGCGTYTLKSAWNVVTVSMRLRPRMVWSGSIKKFPVGFQFTARNAE